MEDLKPPFLDAAPIDKHVLAVAVTSGQGETWGTYIGAVKGEDYAIEAAEVLANGSEIPFELAEELFQDFGKSTRAGDKRQKNMGQSWPQPSDEGTASSTNS